MIKINVMERVFWIEYIGSVKVFEKRKNRIYESMLEGLGWGVKEDLWGGRN